MGGHGQPRCEREASSGHILMWRVRRRSTGIDIGKGYLFYQTSSNSENNIKHIFLHIVDKIFKNVFNITGSFWYQSSKQGFWL